MPMMWFQKIISASTILIIFLFISCKPTNNQPKQDSISSEVVLDADPPSPKPYVLNDPVKFTAHLKLDTPGGVTPNGLVKFTYDNGKVACGDGVPPSREDDQTLKAVCPIDLKGGQHKVSAYYTGDKSSGYAPSYNTGTIDYIIKQFPKQIDSFTVTKNGITVSAAEFGDTIHLTAVMNKSPDDPYVTDENGALDFEISLNPKGDAKVVCPGTATNDQIGTTFTCDYTIQPKDFVQIAHPDVQPYDVILTAHYKGSSYYQETSKNSASIIQVNKITTQIKVTGAKDNIYVLSKTVNFYGDVLDSATVQMIGVPSLYLCKNQTYEASQCINPSTCTIIKNPTTQEQQIQCAHTITEGDVANSQNEQYFKINYVPTDPAYTQTNFAQQSGVPAKLTRTHNIQNISAIPKAGSTYYLTDLIPMTITITVEAPNPLVTPDPNSLYIHKTGDPEDSKRQINCGSFTQNKNIFTCDQGSYKPIVGDVNATFSIGYTIDAPGNYGNYSNGSVNNGNSFINKLPITFTTTLKNNDCSPSSPVPPSVELGDDIHVCVLGTPLQPIGTTLPKPNIIVQKHQSQQSDALLTGCSSSYLPDGTTINIDCLYQTITTDFTDGQSPSISFSAIVSPDDPNYTTQSSALSSQLLIKKIQNVQYIAINIAEYSEYNIVYGQINLKNNIPITPNEQSSVELYRDCSDQQRYNICDNSCCNLIPTYKCTDDTPPYEPQCNRNERIIGYTVVHNSKYYSLAKAQGLQQLSLSTTKTCQVSKDTLINFDQQCDLHTGCDLKFDCPGLGTQLNAQNLTLHVKNITRKDDGVSLPYPKEAKTKPQTLFGTDIPCSASGDGTIICRYFAPITDHFDMDADLLLDDKQYTAVYFENIRIKNTQASKAKTVTQCGLLGTKTSDKSSGQKIQYTTIQRMFDCYQRTTQYAGFTDDNGQTQSPSETKDGGDPNSWYLTSCASNNPAECSWLSPEIPDSPRFSEAEYYPSFVPNVMSVQGANNLSALKVITPQRLKPGMRILWSGILASNTSASSAKFKTQGYGTPFNFFDANGISPRPRAKFPNALAVSADDWEYRATAAGYDLYGSDTNDLQSFYASLQKHMDMPFCIAKTKETQDLNCDAQTNQKQIRQLWSMTAGNSCTNFDQSKSSAKGTSQLCGLLTKYPTTALHPYAYADVCVRTTQGINLNNNTKGNSDLLIYNQQYDWHVPSYPMLLLLTGGVPNSQCEPTGEDYNTNQKAVCLQVKEDAAKGILARGFRAIGNIPNFGSANGQETLWSSSVAVGYNKAPKQSEFAWAFDTSTGAMVLKNLYGVDVIQNSSKNPIPPVVRCASIVW